MNTYRYFFLTSDGRMHWCDITADTDAEAEEEFDQMFLYLDVHVQKVVTLNKEQSNEERETGQVRSTDA